MLVRILARLSSTIPFRVRAAAGNIQIVCENLFDYGVFAAFD